ncbi:hypothetical protein CAAN3_01S08262 [[Candida] anglica]
MSRIRINNRKKRVRLFSMLISFSISVLFTIEDLKFQELKVKDITFQEIDSFYETKLNYSVLLNTSFILPVTEGIVVDHDPRLMPSLWLEGIHKELQNNSWNPQFTLPFSWDSWLDLSNKLSQYEYQSCRDISRMFKIRNIDTICQENDSRKGYILKPNDGHFSERGRRFMGASYLLYTSPNPKRLLFLNVGPNKEGVIVPVDEFSNNDKVDLIEKYAKDVAFVSIQDKLNKLKLDEAMWPQIVTDQLGKFQSITPPSQLQLNISNVDFISDLPNANDSLYSLVLMDNRKYFHEAELLGTYMGSHFDWRFFQTHRISTYDHQVILHRLTRSWLRFANTIGIQTWLAHGTLLGWYWNGLTMPWDSDMDVQVSMKSLTILARRYNQTLVVDTSIQDGYNVGFGQYLLDVGPTLFHRERGNGNNVIDARFIDISTGVYVDITALSFTTASKNVILKKDQPTEFKLLLESISNREDSSNVDSYDDLCSIRGSLWRNKEIFNCKNNHFYTIDELNPLIPTIHEGEIAFVPKKYETILKREYKNGINSTEYREWEFSNVYSMWITKVQRDIHELTSQYTRYSKYTWQHERTGVELNNRSYIQPFLIDPYIIHRSRLIE